MLLNSILPILNNFVQLKFNNKVFSNHPHRYTQQVVGEVWV